MRAQTLVPPTVRRLPLLVVLLVVLFIVLTAGTAFAAGHETIWVVSTVAGTPGVAGNTDGAADAATFNRPTWLGVATISLQGVTPGDVFVIDRANNAIRRITHGSVLTYQVRRYEYVDPTPVTFNFGGPFGGGIAVEPPHSGCGSGSYDSGMFVASSGSEQLALVSMSGFLGERDDVSALIGVANTPGSRDGNAGSVYQPSTEAQFRTPSGLALSWNYGTATTYSRRIYIADTGNHTIRQIAFVFSFEGCPQTRTVVTMAGAAGQPGSADGVGDAARFNSPRGLAAGPDGSVYVADSGNHTIRRITPDGGVTTIAGQAGVPGSDDGLALAAHLNTPSGIAVNANGEIFLTDTGNHTIRMITTDGRLVTIAGLPGTAGFSDGVGPAARFSGPVGITIAPDGSLLVADTSNQVVRRLALTEVTTNHRRAVRP
jgi:hypothetical protein